MSEYQDQISTRTLERDQIQAQMRLEGGEFFSDTALDEEYSLDDADLSGALTARLQQLAYSESE